MCKRNMIITIKVVFLLCIFSLHAQTTQIQQELSVVSSEETAGCVPEDGYVPDEETAIAIAIAVWKPVYGSKIKSARHYEATLENGIWCVSNKDSFSFFPSSGGEPYIEIDKLTGQIIRMYYTK